MTVMSLLLAQLGQERQSQYQQPQHQCLLGHQSQCRQGAPRRSLPGPRMELGIIAHDHHQDPQGLCPLHRHQEHTMAAAEEEEVAFE